MSHSETPKNMANITDASQNKTQTAEEVNFQIARGMADLVRSTLGPLGRDKMMVDASGRTVITNDGASIVRETNFIHPTASLIVGVARTQESESYDGTTSAIILTGELIKEAGPLIQRGVHTTLIERGYNIALQEALFFLDSLTEEVSDSQLQDIAKTAMTGKQAESHLELLGPICVEAAKATNPSKVSITVRPGSTVDQSFGTNGLILDKQLMNHGMPKKLKDASIALFDCDLVLPAHTAGVNVNFDNGTAADEYAQKRKADILAIGEHLKSLGVNVLFTMKEIDPVLSEYFARNNIMAFRRTNNSMLERVAESTNSLIVSSIGDLEAEDLGHAKVVQELSNPAWDKPLISIEGLHANSTAYSILVTGPTEHVAHEISRALDDAIGVTWIAYNERQIVTGGGSTHINMAMHLKQFANGVGGLEQLAVEAFANALEVIPATLAENSGLQPLPSIIALRAAIASGNKFASLDVFNGGVCTEPFAVIEPKKVVTVALQSATTAASQILRIDNIIQAKEAEFME
jgi:chaperonin GroEL (HSP60 family)